MVRTSLRLRPKGTQSPNARPDSPKHQDQGSSLEPEIVSSTRFAIEGRGPEGSRDPKVQRVRYKAKGGSLCYCSIHKFTSRQGTANGSGQFGLPVFSVPSDFRMRVGAYRTRAHALLGTVFSLEFLFVCFQKWESEKHPSALGGKENIDGGGSKDWWRQAKKAPGGQQKGRPICGSRSSSSDWDHEGEARITQDGWINTLPAASNSRYLSRWEAPKRPREPGNTENSLLKEIIGCATLFLRCAKTDPVKNMTVTTVALDGSN